MATVLPPLQKSVEVNNEPVVNPSEKPKNPLASWGAQTMITSYSVDFCKKDCIPTKVRQCSATRRNRPHPSQVRENYDYIIHVLYLCLDQKFIINIVFLLIECDCN